MPDSVEFRSLNWETATELSRVILNNDDRAIDLPRSSVEGMASVFDPARDGSAPVDDSRYTVLSGSKGGSIYVFDFCYDLYEKYGVFIAIEEDDEFRSYLTTGSSAIDFIIELLYKGAVSVETTGNIAMRAKGAVDYLDADIVYPDAGVEFKRAEREIEDSSSEPDPSDADEH